MNIHMILKGTSQSALIIQRPISGQCVISLYQVRNSFLQYYRNRSRDHIPVRIQRRVGDVWMWM